ncbi:putative aryl-alcohol oxidase [Lyophyllum shimeji]|uniref:Aryl-alcohol oxidase n=1 Tax=Lyophyllum shimeji TaxID=47721 RepID=A0A9P3PRQ8_LYOSH|nr:putative aryl-alcohol oxidase [Lyophyllum shimeji]
MLHQAAVLDGAPQISKTHNTECTEYHTFLGARDDITTVLLPALLVRALSAVDFNFPHVLQVPQVVVPMVLGYRFFSHNGLAFLSVFPLVFAGIVEHVRDLPGLEYDFVIVGGGTAGNVVANRLTEDPRHTVLVLEGGGSNANVLNSMVPFFCPRVTPNTPFDWNFTTTAQANLNGRALPYPRGYILGGSSSLSGDPGWSWDRLQSYFRKNEKFTPPADRHDTAGQFNPAVHGFAGINSVSLPGFPQPIDGMVLQTTRELASEFPFNIDTNSGHHLGIDSV